MSDEPYAERRSLSYNSFGATRAVNGTEIKCVNSVGVILEYGNTISVVHWAQVERFEFDKRDVHMTNDFKAL